MIHANEKNRDQRLMETDIRSPDAPLSSAAPDQRRPRNPGYAVLLSNIRTFTLIAFFSCGLLGFTFYLSGRSWHQHPLRAPAVAAQDRTPHAGGLVRDMQVVQTDVLRRMVAVRTQAEARLAAGEYAAAADLLRAALDQWPQWAEAWALQGRIDLKQGVYRDAADALTRALAADPVHPDRLNDLGVAHLYLGHPKQAIALFNMASELDPDCAPAHFNRALYHLSHGQYDVAARALGAFLHLQPLDTQGNRLQAYLLARRGQHEAALDVLRATMIHAPGQGWLYGDAAALAALLNRVPEAIYYLEQVVAMMSPAAVQHLYGQPAFRLIRASEAGQAFARELTERAHLSPANIADADTPPASLHPRLSNR